MRITTFLLGLVVVSLFSFSTLKNEDIAANAGPWKFIEDKNVSFGVDHDVIHLGNIKDDFRFLRLRVTDGPLRVFDMKVYFDNDEVQDVTLRALIPQGGESRVINLNGGLRRLKKIEFWYETAGFQNGKSRVAVWGRR